MTKWTVSQQQAINGRHHTLLVAASAGAGKTAVLTERLVQLVLSEDEPVRWERLLVVTFSEAAATQMRERVERRLRQLLAEAPPGERRVRIARQLALLPRAYISTLHSFCLNLIRRHFVELRLDPDVGVFSPEEMLLLRHEVLDEVLGQIYGQVGEGRDEGMAQWLRDYGGRRGVSQVATLVERLHQYGESLPHPRAWWQGLGTSYDWVDEPLAATSWQAWPASWRQSLLEQARYRLDQVQTALARARRWAERPDGPNWYLPTFDQADRQVAAVSRLLTLPPETPEWDPLHELTNRDWPRLSTSGGPTRRRQRAGAGAEGMSQEVETLVDSGVKRRAQEEWGRARQFWSELRELFALPVAELRDRFARQRPAVAAIARLVLTYDQQLQERKRQLNRIDFADMEHLTLAWLESQAEQGRSGLFTEVLVDEYQDINPLQEEILARLAAGGRRFMVGDAKQSIYRFRHTDPTIFLDWFQRGALLTPSAPPVRAAAPDGQVQPAFGPPETAHASSQADEGCRLVLRENFRSRVCVLAATNWIFRQLMRGDWAELDYTPDQELQAGLVYPPLPGRCETAGAPAAQPAGPGRESVDPPVEVHLIEARPEATLAALADSVEQRLAGDRPDEDGGTDGQTPTVADSAGGDPDLDSSEEGEEGVADPEDPAALTQAQREAAFVAARVHRLIHPQAGDRPADYLVWDPSQQEFRPCQAKDVVILLRSWSHLRFYLEALEQLGMVAVAHHGSGLFRAVEIQQMLALLQVLDNPRRDIPLASFLCSPLAVPARLSLEELSQLRAASPHAGSLWDDCRRCAEAAAQSDLGIAKAVAAKVGQLVRRLEEWRTQARRQPLARLIWEIWQQTGFFEYCGALPAGQQRQANLQFLLDQMNQFDGFARQGLTRAVRFLRSLKEAGAESLAAGTPAVQTTDAIQILSIHESKGLEFPVVILAGLGQRFNEEDVRRPVLFHKGTGIALAGVDPTPGIVVSLPSQAAVAWRLEGEGRAEELRILYVAMTRARERLILCGTLPDVVEQAGRWCEIAMAAPPLASSDGREGAEAGETPALLPTGRLRAARRPLDWLGPAWITHPDACVLRRLAGPLGAPLEERVRGRRPGFHFRFQLHSARELDQLPAERLTAHTAARPGGGPDDLPVPAPSAGPADVNVAPPRWLAAEWWHWQYPHSEAVSRPAKISVTDWQHQVWLADEEQETVPLPPGQLRWPDRWHGGSQAATEDWPRPAFLLQGGPVGGRPVDSSLPPATPAGELRRSLGATDPEHSQGLPIDAATRGTATHRFLQHLDLSVDPLDQAVLIRQRQQLVEREFCTAAEAESIPLDQVEAFLHTELGRWLIQTARQFPARVYRELHFHLAMGEPDDRIMVQGAVDCLVETESGEFVLLDYKTDRMADRLAPGQAARTRAGLAAAVQPAQLDLTPWVERYRFQLQVYRQAIERICHRPVRHTFLVWLDLGGKVSEVP